MKALPTSLLVTAGMFWSACIAAASFDDLMEEYWEAALERDPITATSIGDLRFNDRLLNIYGPIYRAEQVAFERAWLERVAAIDRKRLGEQDRVSYDIFLYDRRSALAGEPYPGHLIPLNQMFGFPTFLAVLGSGDSIQPFSTVKHYDDWLSRVDDATIVFDQIAANLYEGLDRGVTQPRVVMEKVIPQLEAHVVENVEDSLFYRPIKNLPEDFSAADAERLEKAYRQAIAEKIVPAYRRLSALIRDEYVPRTRTQVGWSALPNGTAWYNQRIAVQTTTSLTADEIHQFGLDEVARIRAEMEGVMRKVGFEGDLQAFFRHVQEDDAYFFPTKKALIDAYKQEQVRIGALLPKLFEIAPKTDYVVKPVEAFREQSAAGASYQAGSPDGSRPGVFYINTYNLRAQPRYGTETLTLHEASPGHHFQISVQQELEGLPAFRRFGGYTAFSEGWALYAESLGPELGLFADPYQYYGRLNDEMLRAMRLVVDTGMHAKGWTRERAIAYMLDNSSLAESDVIAEVERYIAYPAQALAYKVGERVIRGLRNEAENRLGEHFNVREFHTQILADGAMPMTVLTEKVRAWIGVTARETAGQRRTALAP